MGQVTTSLTINFGVVDSASSPGATHFSCEVEKDSATSFNKQKSQFITGDSVYIALFKGSSVTGVTPISTAGSVSMASSQVSMTREEVVTFVKSRTADLPLPPLSIVSVEWYGNDLGAVSFTTGQTTLTIGSDSGVGICKVKYVTKADIYVLSGVGALPAAVVVFVGATP